MRLKVALFSGAALISAIAMGVSLSSQTNAAADPDKREIEKIVREYILENPEIIGEALDKLMLAEEQRAEEAKKDALKEHLAALRDPAGGFVLGAADADAEVVVVEFFDYHCGYCKEAAGFVNELAQKEKDVQVVFRELPIIRKESKYAAQYALATRKFGKYNELHMAMMREPGPWTETKLDALASRLGMDTNAIKAELEEDSFEEVLDETLDIAIDIELTGTPSFVVATVDGEYTKVIPAWAPKEITRSIKEARKIAKRS